MGRLQNIQKTLNPKPAKLEGILEAIAAGVAETVVNDLSEGMTRHSQGLNALQERIDTVSPQVQEMITSAVEYAVQETVQRLLPQIEGVTKGLSEKLTQGDLRAFREDLVKALGKVTIPDYTEQLRRLERRQVDLAPVLMKLDELKVEPEEEPSSWVFDIKRDNQGRIISVTANEAD